MVVPDRNGEIRARVVTDMNIGPRYRGFSFVCIGRFAFLQKKAVGEGIVGEKRGKEGKKKKRGKEKRERDLNGTTCVDEDEELDEVASVRSRVR